jgi:hypothetical protein
MPITDEQIQCTQTAVALLVAERHDPAGSARRFGEAALRDPEALALGMANVSRSLLLLLQSCGADPEQVLDRVVLKLLAAQASHNATVLEWDPAKQRPAAAPNAG